MTYEYIWVHTDDMQVHTNDIRVIYEWHTSTYEWHTSEIRMTYEYIRVIYGWHASTYGWYTGTYDWHTNDIRVHTRGIRMTCEYIRMTYGWHARDTRVRYEWQTSNIRNIKLYYGFGAFRSLFSKLYVSNGFWLLDGSHSQGFY